MRTLLMVAAFAALAGCGTTHHDQDAQRPTVSVNYKGKDGFELAQRKAEDYCRKKFGVAGADLLDDDSAGGHATFECVED